MSDRAQHLVKIILTWLVQNNSIVDKQLEKSHEDISKKLENHEKLQTVITTLKQNPQKDPTPDEIKLLTDNFMSGELEHFHTEKPSWNLWYQVLKMDGIELKREVSKERKIRGGPSLEDIAEVIERELQPQGRRGPMSDRAQHLVKIILTWLVQNNSIVDKQLEKSHEDISKKVESLEKLQTVITTLKQNPQEDPTPDEIKLLTNNFMSGELEYFHNERPSWNLWYQVLGKDAIKLEREVSEERKIRGEPSLGDIANVIEREL